MDAFHGELGLKFTNLSDYGVQLYVCKLRRKNGKINVI